MERCIKDEAIKHELEEEIQHVLDFLAWPVSFS